MQLATTDLSSSLYIRYQFFSWVIYKAVWNVKFPQYSCKRDWYQELNQRSFDFELMAIFLAISFRLYGLSGSRLAMIRIGTSDVSPEDVIPTVHNIRVCACQDSPGVDGVTVTFQSGEIGRYLVILMEQKGVLALCEVQVFKGTVSIKRELLCSLYVCA